MTIAKPLMTKQAFSSPCLHNIVSTHLTPYLLQVSISFHENGKRHKESVEKKVKEIQRKGSEREKKEKDEKKFLEMMEKGAAAAIEKDIKQDPR